MAQPRSGRRGQVGIDGDQPHPSRHTGDRRELDEHMLSSFTNAGHPNKRLVTIVVVVSSDRSKQVPPVEIIATGCPAVTVA